MKIKLQSYWTNLILKQHTINPQFAGFFVPQSASKCLKGSQDPFYYSTVADKSDSLQHSNQQHKIHIGIADAKKPPFRSDFGVPQGTFDYSLFRRKKQEISNDTIRAEYCKGYFR